SSRNAGSGCTRTKSCGCGRRTGTVVSNFFTDTPSVNVGSSRKDAGSNGSGAVTRRGPGLGSVVMTRTSDLGVSWQGSEGDFVVEVVTQSFARMHDCFSRLVFGFHRSLDHGRPPLGGHHHQWRDFNGAIFFTVPCFTIFAA